MTYTSGNTSVMYNVYLFEENDNFKVVFDKHNIVQHVLDLYNKMQVNIKSIDTSHRVGEAAKDIVSFVLGGGTNCFPISHQNGITEALQQLQSFLSAAQTLDYQKRCLTIGNSVNKVPESVLKTRSDLPEFLHSRFSKIMNNDDKSVAEEVAPMDVSAGGEYVSVIDEIIKQEKQCASIVDGLSGQGTQQGPLSVCILYNTVYECAIVCDINKTLHQVVKEFPEFQIVREYKDLKPCKHNILKEYFSKNMYNELEVVNKKLTAYENLYDITNTDPLEEQRTKILCYIKNYYNISNQPDKRIKVSTLLEEVEKDLNITSSQNLKYRFASMLAELGLQKKRYSDGMYIYGIESKSMAKVHSSDVAIKDYMSTHKVSA
jgi:hypothetical protein